MVVDVDEQAIEDAPLDGIGVLELVDESDAERRPKQLADRSSLVGGRSIELGEQVRVRARAVAPRPRPEQRHRPVDRVAVAQGPRLSIGALERGEPDVGVLDAELGEPVQRVEADVGIVKERAVCVEGLRGQDVGDRLTSSLLAGADFSVALAERGRRERVDRADRRGVELDERELGARASADRVGAVREVLEVLVVARSGAVAETVPHRGEALADSPSQLGCRGDRVRHDEQVGDADVVALEEPADGERAQEVGLAGAGAGLDAEQPSARKWVGDRIHRAAASRVAPSSSSSPSRSATEYVSNRDPPTSRSTTGSAGVASWLQSSS